MDVNALRSWGIVVGSALMAGALLLSMPGAQQAEAQAPAEAQGVFEVAQAPAQAEPVAFLVRFQGSGPIASAQARAQRGQTQAAQRTIETQLSRQVGLRGLCFDRFTVGAAEVVLRSCASVPANERAAFQQRWVARLQAMRAVDYVDANATVSPGRAG
jgi:hypothetical protein